VTATLSEAKGNSASGSSLTKRVMEMPFQLMESYETVHVKGKENGKISCA
jgi:hypothetical protein